MPFKPGQTALASLFGGVREWIKPTEFPYTPELINITDPKEVVGRFTRLDEHMVRIHARVTFGPSTSVGGTIEIGLPNGEVQSSGGPLIQGVTLVDEVEQLGNCWATRLSPFTRATGRTIMSERTFSRMIFDATNQVGANATYPWAWADGDILVVDGLFKADFTTIAQGSGHHVDFWPLEGPTFNL
jgi:hypothetical protein